MNKHLYRIVFNKARGLLMVVAENVLGSRKAGGRDSPKAVATANGPLLTLRPLRWSLMAALGLIALVAQPAWADIVADHGAPAGQQPGVITTANGVPQVNIQTPSAAGVSHNTYSQFDVNTQGAILNNSRTNVQTQLGGWIEGNQALANGTARVILNEVNATNPSQLRGYVEVGGDRAQVVIANPAGIACDGCGFINANRATLTTGTVQMQDGQIQGYRVGGGKVSITGKGLDAGQTDYTDVIARSVEVNAGVWANDLRVTAGANQVNADNTTATPIAGTGDTPSVAIDVAQLGGMYAGKIKLVGTEAGMGVRNAGQIGASAGDVVISADGQLSNRGQISSTGNLQLTGQRGIDNSGDLYSQGDATLTTAGTLANSAQVAAARHVTLSAAQVSNSNKGLLAAGVNADGLVTGNGTLNVSAQQAINNQGSALAAGDVSLNAAQLNLAGSDSSGQNINLHAGNGDIDLAGATVDSAQTLSASASQALKTDAAKIKAQRIQLTARDLSNRQGKILQTGAGTLQVTVSGLLDNSGGTLANEGDIRLASGRLLNQGGTLGSVSGELHVTASDLFDNTSGVALALGAITINSQGLTNTNGQVSGADLHLNSGGQALLNHGGLVLGKAVDIQSGELNNQAGLIQASGLLTVNTHGQTLLNSDSGTHNGLLGQGGLALYAGLLNNNAGFIGSQGDITLAASQFDNTAGATLTGEKSLTLNAAGLNNQGGAIQTLGAASLNLANGQLSNAGGLLRAGGSLDIVAGILDNQNTRGTDLGIEGRALLIDAAQVNNQSGALRADETLTLQSAGHLDNSQGLVSSSKQLLIKDTQAHRTLAVTNNGGTLIAGDQLSITSASLGGTGSTLSTGDINLDLGSSLVNSGTLQANGTIDIKLQGSLDNQAGLLAGNALKVSASSVTNRANGEISAAQVTLNATGNIDNRGLIDAQITRINSSVLNNLGSGRLYGDQVSIAVQTLNNDVENGQAAVIAARNRLDIGAQSILNREHALLFSAGDLHIGGALDADGHASGQAALLQNASATIEALGDLSLASAVIRNTNEHFSTHQVVVGSQTLQDYQLTGSPTRYQPSEISIYNDEVDHLRTPAGNNDNFNRYDYTRTTTETQVLTSDPGQILSGGSMLLTANTALNDNSQILAGGVLTGNIGQLNNTETAGQRVTTDSGTVSHFYRIQRKGRDRQGRDTTAYNPAASVVDIFVQPTRYTGNTNQGGSGTQLADRQVNQVNQQATGAQGANVNLANGRNVTPVEEVTALQGTSGDSESIRSGGINVQLPDNSLFHVDPQATPGYIVESDPRFTSYRDWLSSDYMLDRLSLNPALTLTRLGDGFYEQKLVREQVAQLTGRRFLDGYASDESQYRALLDNGLTYAGQWNLVPGVALTTEQMAQLTSDIVWLVEKDVTLPDGTVGKALAPEVYVRVRDGDINGAGGLLSGNAVDLNVKGDLVNSSTLAGRSVLAITAQNIQNLGGRLSGGEVGVQALTDLNNLGGIIDASKSLTVSAGRDINLVSSTRDTQSTQGTATQVSRVAGLYVSGPAASLVASAGRDINMQAAQVTQIDEGGTTTLNAGHDLNLGTVTEKRSQSVKWNASNWREDTSRTEVGSTVDGSGDVRLLAGNDINARGASLTSAQGAVQAAADHDINLTESRQYNSVDEAHKVKGGNSLFSSKTTTTRDTLAEDRAKGTTVSSESAYLQAGNDLRLQGSNVVSTDGTTLTAGHDVQILAATDTVNEKHTKDVKQSGLFSGGGVAVTMGTQQQSAKNTSDIDSSAASTVGATNGNVNIIAGNNYRQVGSDVSAPVGDVNIQAQKVDILEAQNAQHATQESRFKQSGLTVTLTNPVVTALQTAQHMGNAAGDTDDNRLKILAAANAGLETASAYSAVVANPAQAGGINVSISIGTNSNESQSEQTGSKATGSSVRAGGDVNITATGAGQASDITVQGSEITAGRDANLKADGDIALLAAQNTVESHGTNKGSSASLGIGFAVGGTQNGFTLNAGASMNRGNADGNDLVWSNTHVNAGNSVLLQSGGDTQLKGAVVAAPQVRADVGGNLSIESLQDTSTYASKQSSTGVGVSLCIPPFCYGMSSASVSLNNSKDKSDFASVLEQSGIQAGDGGFDVRVKGNTDLVGGVIASSDAAIANGKNTLSTGTLTTADLLNRSSASASTSGVSLSSDMFTQGKYGASKGIVSTLLNNGQDSSSSQGATRSAVSAGNVVIGDGSGQWLLTGQDANQTIAGLNRDTANAQDAVGKQDVAKLAKSAAAQQAIKNETYRQMVQFTDEAYRTMFVKEAKMFVVLTDENGKVITDDNGIPQRRELNADEKANLQRSSDNKVHLADNGIFNDEDGAAKYAVQHRDPDVTGPQYFIWFPQADNSLSELLVAAYQKNLENNFWGLANATEQTRTAMLNYGESGLHLDGHSRGTMTVGNAMGSIMSLPDAVGSLSDTQINFFGAAYSVYKADEQLATLQNRDAVSSPSKRDDMVLQYQIHENDPVGRSFFVGDNPSTGGVLPDTTNGFKEFLNVLGGTYTVHNCYGAAAPAACQQYWTDQKDNKAHYVKVNAKQE
ncbi:two-partner secretion domain-containing protein [Pseudomonas abieticivorans]|uniref:two-partner secretion domain-containing protein n=1 Tax=Pseudomonas abieticivorans TaxID=2931382 RepID=UPI0020BE145B|nr:hemagglutinin repeat-containing protein [Pseudomonas sp. PIA16]